jgi:hypothetical protein
MDAMRIRDFPGMGFLNRHFARKRSRMNARYAHLERSAARDGFYIYKKNLIWQKDAAFLAAKAKNISGIPDDRCFTLLELSRKAAIVDGDIAECGVRWGKSALFMLSGLTGAEKPIHLFDSFEGLSEPGKADIAPGRNRTHWKKGRLAVSEDVVLTNLGAFKDVHIHKGWIPERFGEVADRTFALVHIDVDLYQPTADSLAFFYPRMSKGGFIVCDDYGFEDCAGAKRAFDEFFADRPEQVILLTTGQCVVMIQAAEAAIAA